MEIKWHDIGFQPDDHLSRDIREAWAWLFEGESFHPFVCSRLGDCFFTTDDGMVGWLNCSAGKREVLSITRSEFDRACRRGGEEVDEWFGPGLVAAAHEAGKCAGPDQAYLFIVLPIFAECRYEPVNMGVVPIREVFVGLADVHRQMETIPDGSKVNLKIVE